MPYVFGPVPSRRLGLSLGVDLIPAKTCSYECLYCQVGKTTLKTVETRPFVSVQAVLAELEGKLEKASPDTITLAGSGEPTLNAEIDTVISAIKRMTSVNVAVLTNGSLFWNETVRNRVSGAHIILPTLSTVFEETFTTIHGPHPDITLPPVIQGLVDLRKTFRGRIFIEVIFLAGFNDTEREMAGLRRVIDRISPDKIQINTVVRPPADSRALPLDRQRLEEIRRFFGEKAEVIAESPRRKEHRNGDSLDESILEMVRRRPLRAHDMSNALNISLEEAAKRIRVLMAKGELLEQAHDGSVYFSSAGV